MGVSLACLMGWRSEATGAGMTHRQFLVISRWLRDQWNQPSRTDHYLMQIACEVIRSRVEKPGDVQMSHCKIPFRFGEGSTGRSGGDAESRSGSSRPRTREQSAAWAKMRWMGLVASPSKIDNVDEGLLDEIETLTGMRQDTTAEDASGNGNGLTDGMGSEWWVG